MKTMSQRLSRPQFSHGFAHRGGFTLLELIFVVTLVALIASIGLPRFSDWLAFHRVDNAARVVAGDLENALTLAGRQGTPVRVSFDAVAMELRITDRGSGTVLHRRSLGTEGDTPVETASATGLPLDTYPNRTASGPLTLTLVSGGHQRRVEMSSAGFIRVTG